MLSILLIYAVFCYAVFPVLQVLPEWNSSWLAWPIAPIWLPGIAVLWVALYDVESEIHIDSKG